FLYDTADHRHLHSFPTRRSSDLLLANQGDGTLAHLDPRGRAPLPPLRVDADESSSLELVPDGRSVAVRHGDRVRLLEVQTGAVRDRKSTRLNSSHLVISYAVFCL